MPSTDTIEEHWEEAEDNPDETIHFTSDLEIFIRFIDDNPEIANEKIPEKLGPISDLHPLIAAVEALRQWKINDGSYEHARAAEHLLSESLQRGLDEDHDSVVVRSLQELINLQAKLSHDNSEELSTAVDFLDDRYYEEEKGSRSGFTETIELVLQHTDPDETIDRGLLQRLFVICIVRANRYRQEDDELGRNVSDQSSCRDFLGQAIEIGSELDIYDADLKRRYTDEYWRYVETQGERDTLLKGSIIDEALRDPIVSETLSDGEKVVWKNEMQDSVRKGGQELKRSGKKIARAPPGALKEQSETVQDIFKNISVYDNPTKALYWLVNEVELLPPYGEQNPEHHSIVDLVNNLHPQLSGHLTQVGPDSDITQDYAQDLLQCHLVTSGAVVRLIEEGWLRERHFFQLLNMVSGLSEHTIWYLTDAIDYLFNKEYAASIHISIPRLESTLYELLNDLGDDVVRQMDGGTGTRTLTPLISQIDSYTGEEFQRYIEYAYNKKEGETADGNLRNRTAHGHLRIGQDHHINAVMPIVDILRIGYQLRPTPFVATFGYPSKYLYVNGSQS
ncbi:hypothetical protein [Halobacterium salinarum]|uniref:hypothetical protein n=1 Tax=Halobacterium salinarum TaxID=2242 RepID=UPI002556ED9B|nr:hypothetical protein [Halobacterium salinarum]MDL0123608.1 hypothetical protein [Halobacterium salinarum]